MALLHECYLVLFFFSCSRSCTNINEYEHLKKRPSANVNRGGSRGKVRSGRGGGERTPSHKNCGYFYFLSESMIPPTTGWHITAKFPRLKHLSRLFRLLCKKKKMNQRSNPSIKNSWIQLCLSAFRHADVTHNVMTFRKILTNSGSSETTRSQVGLMYECAALMKLTAPLE